MVVFSLAFSPRKRQNGYMSQSNHTRYKAQLEGINGTVPARIIRLMKRYGGLTTFNAESALNMYRSTLGEDLHRYGTPLVSIGEPAHPGCAHTGCLSQSMRYGEITFVLTVSEDASTSARVEALKSMVQGYPYRNHAQKLTEAQFDTVVAFIEDNDTLGHLEFEYKANRWLIDNKEPKKTIMWDLLVSANSRVHVRRRGNQNGKQ
jgi:hypothetical protein